jgi:hypothetical protein
MMLDEYVFAGSTIGGAVDVILLVVGEGAVVVIVAGGIGVGPPGCKTLLTSTIRCCGPPDIFHDTQ